MRTRIAFPLLLTLLCLSWTDRFAAAQDGHDFQICEGSFALCAASTCTPTGNKIRVNGPSACFLRPTAHAQSFPVTPSQI
jgi:hypothetical protein